LDKEVIDGLSKTVGQEVNLFDEDSLATNLSVADMTRSLKVGKPVSISYPTPATSFGHLQLADRGDARLGYLQVKMNRSIHQLEIATVKSLLGGISFIVLIVAGAILILLDRILVRKLGKISRWLANVDHTGMSTDRLAAAETDEIGSLSHAINGMLDAISAHEKQIEQHTTALQNLLRVLSHDLANSLTIIESSAKFAAEDRPDDRNVARIIRGAGSLRRIISHVKEMDAQESGKAELKVTATSLSTVIDHLKFTFADKAAEKGLNLAIELSQDLQAVADETLLTNTVLGNLVSNAIKFTPPGKEIVVAAVKHGDLIKIEVRDQGIGIPKELRDIVFSPTAPTTRPGTQGEKGTGFGMPLVKAAVERMGGRVNIHSSTAGEEGRSASGTTVTIELRAA
jgi:signal transduction histidine kinase